jgi:cell division septation protein DedD
VKATAPPRTAGGPSKTVNAPVIPGGSYTLQVAAVTKEADAMELAARLQKKKFPAFVLSPQADKYFRVQVGPYPDPKAAEAARKGLEGAGFKAIVKH